MASAYRPSVVALLAVSLFTTQAPQDAQSRPLPLAPSRSNLPSGPAQDVCTDLVSPEMWSTVPPDIKLHVQPISAAAWAALSPDARRYVNAADSFTLNFVQTIFPEGPYPSCLYQSIRAYFLPGSEGAVERAQARRQRALEIIRLVEATLKN